MVVPQVGPRGRRRRCVPAPPSRRAAAREGDDPARRGLLWCRGGRARPRVPVRRGHRRRRDRRRGARHAAGGRPDPRPRALEEAAQRQLRDRPRAPRSSSRGRTSRWRRRRRTSSREWPRSARSARRASRVAEPCGTRVRGGGGRALADHRGAARAGRHRAREHRSRPVPSVPVLDLARPRILARRRRRRIAADPARPRVRTRGSSASCTTVRTRPTASRSTTTRSARSASRRRPPRTSRSSTRSTAPWPTTAPRSCRSPTPRRAPRSATWCATTCSNMYTRSRLAVPAPLGGSDRDINTSEELLQYSTAYDTLARRRVRLRRRPTRRSAPTSPTSRPSSTSTTGTRRSAQQLHVRAARTTTGRSRPRRSGVAALALLDGVPAQGAPPADDRVAGRVAQLRARPDRPRAALDVRRPDGGYGEGPYYQRYASQNLLPFLRAWDHARGNRTWDVGGREIADLWRRPAVPRARSAGCST